MISSPAAAGFGRAAVSRRPLIEHQRAAEALLDQGHGLGSQPGKGGELAGALEAGLGEAVGRVPDGPRGRADSEERRRALPVVTKASLTS